MPSGTAPLCKTTGKRRYVSLEQAKMHAKAFTRGLNSQGVFSETLYAYTCEHCGRLHLTRMATWQGTSNTLVFVAPSLALQRWAMERNEGIA